MSRGEERIFLYCFCLTCWKFVLLQGFHTISPSSRKFRWLNGLKIFTKGCPCISGFLAIILNVKTSKPEYSKKKSSPSLYYMLSDPFVVFLLTYLDLFRWLSAATLSLQIKQNIFPLQHGLVFEYVCVNVYLPVWDTTTKYSLECVFASDVCALRIESSYCIH